MACRFCGDSADRAVNVGRDTAEGRIDEDAEICRACREIIKAVVEGKTHKIDPGE